MSNPLPQAVGEPLGNPHDQAVVPRTNTRPEAGVHPKVVQERLGHATIAITLDTYSHAIPAMQEDAAARIASLLEQ